LLPHTDTAIATQVTERLRAKLAEITVTTGHGNGAPVPLQVTVSIGVATRSPDLRLPDARTAPRRCR
jgi:PleD family two-component response regulator